MIALRGVFDIYGAVKDVEIPSAERREIDAAGLTLLPGLIDPHVHFRVPGLEHKENWETAARAAIAGGITTVFDMPNTLPPTITLERLEEKSALIDAQLQKAGIGLRYGLYLGADKHHFEEIARCKEKMVAIKVFMGASTGDLVMDDDASLHAVFQLAAKHDLLVAVHAEEEELIRERTRQFADCTAPKTHSEIRNNAVALRATEKAIALARQYGTRLYILHCSTKEEIQRIAAAKKEGLSVYAEVTPHHLFLTTAEYAKQGVRVQMNPPLRSEEDRLALWEAIQMGVVDTIGSDHAPHTLEEKALPYGKAPSGVPGVETTLPLLLDACNRGKISLRQIVSLMHTRIQEIFRWQGHEDFVLVDMKKKRTVEAKRLKSRCGWSPYEGMTLQGWPVYTILQGKVYEHS